MAPRLDRDFWIVNLLALTLVAWLVAQAVMDQVSARYLSTSEPLSEQAVGMSAPPPLRHTRGSAPMARVLTERRPFNVDAPVVVTPSEPACQPNCAARDCGSDGCGDVCGECANADVCDEDAGRCVASHDQVDESELNLSLHGTLVSPVDATARWAKVEVDGASQLLTVGAELLGGKATVVDIRPKVLYLKEGDRLTYVTLWSESGGKVPRASESRAVPPLPPAPVRPSANDGVDPRADRTPPPPEVKTDFAQFVKQESAGRYTINRQMLDEQLQDLSALGAQARAIPNFVGGKYQGFKLVGVRPGSLYRAIGIRSGDIVRSINGQAINSPNKAMELFTELQNASTLNIEVERRGQLEAIEYVIR